jgi:hypothetical protein
LSTKAGQIRANSRKVFLALRASDVALVSPPELLKIAQTASA